MISLCAPNFDSVPFIPKLSFSTGKPLVPGLKLLEYISLSLLQDYVVKSPKFMFHEGREHEKRFNFPFLNSDTAF